jgi:acyl-CoA thioesterase FadM
MIYFDDEVTITFAVETVGRTSATYVTRLEARGELAAEGRMVVVLVDDAGRPRAWPTEAAALLRG